MTTTEAKEILLLFGVMMMIKHQKAEQDINYSTRLLGPFLPINPGPKKR
jgi:hypothetical protein